MNEVEYVHRSATGVYKNLLYGSEAGFDILGDSKRTPLNQKDFHSYKAYLPTFRNNRPLVPSIHRQLCISDN